MRVGAAVYPGDEPEVAWWESYGDPVLSELIRKAARENRDVKIAPIVVATDDKGELRQFINIYRNDEDIRFGSGLKTPLKDSDDLSIVPAVAGG